MNNFSEQLVRRLADWNLTQAFAVPGGGNMFLLNALCGHPNINVTFCHHEQAAAIAAEGFFKASGKAAICLVTSGPGGTNAITGIAGAFLDSSPMLVLAGQVKTQDIKTPGLRQLGPQEVDLVSIIEPVCLSASRLVNGKIAELDREVGKLFSVRSGPVVIEIPLDVQNSGIDEAAKPNISAQTIIEKNNFHTDLDDALFTFQEACRPVVIIGNGCRGVSSDQMTSFFNCLRLSGSVVLFTWLSYDLLPWDEDLNMGRPGSVALRHSNIALQSADSVLVLGSRIDNTQTAFNMSDFARQAKVAVVDIDAAELAKLPDRFTKLEMTASSAIGRYNTLFANAHSQHQRPRWREYCKDLKRTFGREDPGRESQSGLMRTEEVVDCLSETMPPNALIVTGSSGLAVEIFHLRFRNSHSQRVFLTTALGAMGFGLPAVVGAATAAGGERPIFLYESDGSLMMNLQELSTLSALSYKVCVVLVNNDGYASIRSSQQKHFGTTMGTSAIDGLKFPNFGDVISAHGVQHQLIESGINLREAIIEWRKDPKTVVLELKVDPDSQLLPKCAVSIEGSNFGSSKLEYMDPPLDSGVVESYLKRARNI